jgi:peptide deformylase
MIIVNNEELLRVQCQEVLPNEVGALIETLEKELDYANKLGKNGIGLAAPQIGIAKSIAIVRTDKLKFNLINAKIEQGYDPSFFKEEGCLSFPGRVENTTRFQEVVVINNLLPPHRFIATGLVAVICQHEIDHLNATLFIDHIAPEITKPVPVIKKSKVGPNDPCSCGSGKKFKKCHGR